MRLFSRSGLSGFRFGSSLKTWGRRRCAARWLPVLMAMVFIPQLARADGGPSISLTAYPINNNQVVIVGQVSDDGGADNLTVSLSGVVDCTAVTDSNGNFSVGAEADCLGQINAGVMDRDGLTGGGGTVLDNPAPSIDFGIMDEGYGFYTLQGHVNDTWAPGLEVIFSGFGDVSGQSATCDEDGNFELTVTLDPSDCGLITASVQNWWGQSTSQSDYVDASN